MAPEVRVDTDYNPSDDDMRMLLKGVHRLLKRPAGNHYHEGEGGDNKRMLAWILTVTSLLAVGGISGGIVMYGQLSSLRAMVTQWQMSSDRRQDQTDRRLERLETRQ